MKQIKENVLWMKKELGDETYLLYTKTFIGALMTSFSPLWNLSQLIKPQKSHLSEEKDVKIL